VFGRCPAHGRAAEDGGFQEHLLDPLAMKLLEGEFKPDERIKVSERKRELVFEKK